MEGKKKKQYQDVDVFTVTTQSVSARAQITGYRRIWRNGALVYDGEKRQRLGS